MYVVTNARYVKARGVCILSMSMSADVLCPRLRVSELEIHPKLHGSLKVEQNDSFKDTMSYAILVNCSKVKGTQLTL